VTEHTDGLAVVASQRKQLSADVPLCDDLETLIDTLPVEHAANLMAYAVEISHGIRSAVVGLIAAGNALLKTKSLLSDDEWTRYATAVTGGKSTRWCEKAIEAFEFAQQHPDIDLTRLTVGAVFELSAPSMPAEVVEHAAQRVAQCDPPTTEELKELKVDAQRVAPIDHDVDRTTQQPQIDANFDEKTGKALLLKIRSAVAKAHEHEQLDQAIISMLDSLVGEIQIGTDTLVGLDDVTIAGLLKQIGA